MVVYGPYEWWHANVIEAYEINKRYNNKHLLSKTNVRYGNYKKISVKDSGRKTVFLFREGVKVEKMVS